MGTKRQISTTSRVSCASIDGGDEEEFSETKTACLCRSGPAPPNFVTGTPLRIPYGNKDAALKLGARYRSGGWYAPPEVDLSAFGERGWL